MGHVSRTLWATELGYNPLWMPEGGKVVCGELWKVKLWQPGVGFRMFERWTAASNADAEPLSEAADISDI